jgi:hypothetical protein
MALIARPHLPSSTPNAALASIALFVAAAALAAVLSTVQLPSSATQGLPADWAQRGAWLAVQALIGLGIACVLMGMARRWRTN